AVEPVEVVADSGASGGAEPECAEPGGAESGGAEPGGAEPGGAEPERAEPGGAASGGAEPWAAGSGGVEPAGAGPGGPSGALSRRELPSLQELCEWFARRWNRAARAGGAAVAGGSAAAGGSGAGGAAGAVTGGSASAGGAGATGPGGARPGGTGAGGAARVGATGGTGAGAAVSTGGSPGAGAAGGTGAGGAAGVGADAGGTGVVPAGSGGSGRPRPYFVPLLEQVLGIPPSPSPAPPLECPPPVQSESQLQLVSPLPAPSPYAGPTGGLAERREPESRPASPVRTARTSRRVPRQRPPAVPGTHQMALRPSTAPQRVPLPSPPESSLPALADPESDSLRAANPTVTRVLATVVTDPSFESTVASALVAELVDFAAHCRLDYAASLVAESASVCPPSVGGECALSTDVLEDRQEEFQCFSAALPHLMSTLLAPEGDPDAPDISTPRSYAEAIEGPYSSQWQAAMDAKMASGKSTCTYVDEVPPPGANIISGMWIFRVKRPPGSPPVFKARYVTRGFSQRQGVDYFQTFSPTPKMTTLRVLLHVAAQRDYELHSLDFSTAFLQGNLHEEIWLRRPPGFTGTTLAALGFAPSTADTSLFLRTDTLLPPFYILVYVDDLVFATADTAGLAHVKSELQKRHTCTDLGELRSYLGLHITRDRARRTITLTQLHMVQQVLQRFDFTYSSPQATPLFTRHSLSALPSDESVEPSGPYPELVGCLMYLMTCTRPDLAYPLSILARYVAPGRHRPEHMAAAKRVLRYLCSTSGLGLVLGGRSPVVLTGHTDASWVDDLATQRSSQGYTFSLGSGSVSWRSTRSSSVLNSSCEAEIYAGAMAAQELRWLTYLLTDLGEPPRSPPVYVDNKAMLALCREHRLEHRTKHIALRYFLARELQQRGQLRLAYVASQANTADIFTKALQPCDHQRFCTMLARSVPRNLHLVCEPGCLHNGTCKLSPKTKEPECVCQPYDHETGLYFRGKSCQTEAVRCNATWWCENGGRCVAMGAQGFLCSCAHKFQGSKCQTPVVACSTGLWCANGGMCVFSEEANATICKCPSTHTGASCQTLVEAQDFGPSEQLRTNFTSPLIIPSNSTLDLLVDERDQYFHTFFALLGALVFVWLVSLCFVYHSRERRRSSRAIAVVGVLEAPPPSRLHKQQQQQLLLQKKKQQKQSQQQNGKVIGTQENEQDKQHLSGRDFGSTEGPLVQTCSSSSAVLSSVPVRRNPSSGISGGSSSNNIADSSAMGNVAVSSSSSSSVGNHQHHQQHQQHQQQQKLHQQKQHGTGYVPPEITQDMGNGSGGDSIGEHGDATDAEVAALFAVPQGSSAAAGPSVVLLAAAEAAADDAFGQSAAAAGVAALGTAAGDGAVGTAAGAEAAAAAAATAVEADSRSLLLSSLSSLIQGVDSSSQMNGSDCERDAESRVMDSLPGGGVGEGDMAEVLLSHAGEESSSGGIMKSSRRKRAGTGDDVRLLL
ncbi:unnamed protein product, partial [Closterium sp. NIES-53]